ncbi:hypothetical protein D3C81_2335980 [compost metagenome]
MPLKNHTSGISRVTHSSMGRTTTTATRSGMLMARRLGIRSAIRIKRLVTTTKETTELIWESQGP